MNLIFSYTRDDDQRLAAEGHRFIGAGTDEKGGEVHVFLNHKCRIASNSGKDEEFDWHKQGFWVVKNFEGEVLFDTLAETPYSARATFLRNANFRWSAAVAKGYEIAEFLEVQI